ncbi:MAG: hypothetical protein FWC58_01195 [Desulfobulbus sp.]|nr:hypothetical protein [Desulfobulbus sp.]
MWWIANCVAWGVGALLIEGAAGTKRRAVSFRVACFLGWVLLLPVSFVVALLNNGAHDVLGWIIAGGALALAINMLAWAWNIGRAAVQRARGGEAPSGEESKRVDSGKVVWVVLPVLVVALIVKWAWPAKHPAEVAAPAAEQVAATAEERVEPVGPAVAGVEQACPCGGESLCTGPRGGRYCLTAGGNKKYLSGDNKN